MAAGGFRLTGLALGTAASPTVQLTGDTNTGVFSPGADRLSMATAGVARLEVGADGNIYINDTTNAEMLIGLTINQGGNDDEIVSLKSSDIAHGMTGISETDTYGLMAKATAANGGLFLIGLSQLTTGAAFFGYHTTDNTAKTTGAAAAMQLTGALRSGTGVTDCGVNANLLTVVNNTTTRFILDADGDSHQDVGTAWTNFDDEDDIRLLNLLAAHVTRPDDPMRASFGAWLAQERNILEELHLVSFNDGPQQDGHAFMNMSRLTMLHTGAIRQLGAQLKRCERALNAAGLMLAVEGEAGG